MAEAEAGRHDDAQKSHCKKAAQAAARERTDAVPALRRRVDTYNARRTPAHYVPRRTATRRSESDELQPVSTQAVAMTRKPPDDEAELHDAIEKQIHELADMEKSDVLSDDMLSVALYKLLLDENADFSTIQTGVRMATPTALRVVLTRITIDQDKHHLIRDLIELRDEGQGIRALLALAVHLIQCHKPENQ